LPFNNRNGIDQGISPSCDAGRRFRAAPGTLWEHLIWTMAAWRVPFRSHTGMSGGLSRARRVDTVEPGRAGDRWPEYACNVAIPQVGAEGIATYCLCADWLDCSATCSSWQHPIDAIASALAIRAPVGTVRLTLRELAGHGAALRGPSSGKNARSRLLIETSAGE